MEENRRLAIISGAVGYLYNGPECKTPVRNRINISFNNMECDPDSICIGIHWVDVQSSMFFDLPIEALQDCLRKVIQ